MKPLLSPPLARGIWHGLLAATLFYVLLAGVVLLVMLAIAEGGR